MKIAIDVRCINNKYITGIERMTLKLLEHWPDSCSTITAYLDKPTDYQFANCQKKIIKSFSPAVWFNILLPYHLYKDDIDVFVTPITLLPIFLPTKIKTFSIVNDLAYFYFPNEYKKSELKILHTKTARAIKNSDHLIAISESTKKDIIKFYQLPPKKTSVVHLASDIDQVKIEHIDKKIISDPYLLTIGTAYGRKNLKIIVPILKILKQKYSISPRVVMTGKSGFDEKNIMKAAKENRVDLQIIHLGYVSEGTKATLYKNAAAFFFPSLYEGFGIPVLEAMALGCPVICSNASSLPEIANDAALFINPKSPKSCAETINKLLTNANLRSNLINKGNKNIQRFTWKKTANNFYKSIISTE